MAINTDFLNKAIKGLEEGTVWIALNDTSSDVKLIKKDSCLVRAIKNLLKCCGWDWYGHINSRNILNHLKTRDWTAVDPATMNRFYKLFEERIRLKYSVEPLKPSLGKEEAPTQPIIDLKGTSPTLSPLSNLDPKPLATEVDKDGNTPLHVAILNQGKKEVALFFCNESHANVNAKNNSGDTPLHLLAGFNHIDKPEIRGTVEFLLSQGADKTLVNNNGEQPIHKAFKRGGSTVIDLLTPEDCQMADCGGWTPLHLAASDSQQNFNQFKQIFSKSKDVTSVDKHGKTALHFAASSGFYEAVEFMIANKVPVDTPDAEGNSPLLLAVWMLLSNSFREISSQSQLDQMRQIIAVLSSGEYSSRQVRFQVDPRYSGLHSEALKRIINLLLDNGANAFQRNKEGECSIDKCNNWVRLFSTFNTESFFRS
jgi:ankyrin repeat protein